MLRFVPTVISVSTSSVLSRRAFRAKTLTYSRRHLVALGLLTILPTIALPFDGFAVSVSYRHGTKDFMPLIAEDDDGAMKGRICRFTIRNGESVECDTIFYGMALYPAISWDGTRVAFFRYGIHRGDIGNTLEGWDNPVTTHLGDGQRGIDPLYGSWDDAWISIVDRDGSIRNLVKLPCRPASQNGLDWPVGDWVYYANPNPSMNRNGSEVRRVNVNTGQDEHVASFGGLWMRRFTMPLDGQSVASQTMGDGGSNTLFSLPSLSSLRGLPACNISVSPSGDLLANYLGGNHKEIWAIDPRNPSLWDAANWNPNLCFTTTDADGSLGCEVIRWSVNSDKWLTQCVGWYGHAGNLNRGSNSLLMNWLDHEALCVSSNPKIPASNPDAAVLYIGNCCGDFFLDAPMGKYEDVDGVWYDMPNCVLPVQLSADTVRFAADEGAGNPVPQTVNVTLSSGTTPMAFTVTDDAPWLNASVQGSPGSQSVAVSADISGLSSGDYAGTVKLAGGALKMEFQVKLRVNGASSPASLPFTQETMYVQAGGSVGFGASLLDQFGQTIAGTVSWSVSGGGTISSSGEFTSNGDLGPFEVTAQSGSVSQKGAVVVTANKPLPTQGYLKELLCLESAGGSPYLPLADAGGIESACTGTTPTAGQQVTVNGNTYTWQLRSDADGEWADDGSEEDVVAYWFTILISQSTRTAQIVSLHDDGFTAWRNGELLTRRPWATSGLEDWSAHFTIEPGGTGVLLKLNEDWGGNQMAVRFVDPTTDENILGVQYFPPGDVPVGNGASPRVVREHVNGVIVAGNRIRILAESGKPSYRVSIVASNGAVVRSQSGHAEGEVVVSLNGLAAGVYVARLTKGTTSAVARVLVR